MAEKKKLKKATPGKVISTPSPVVTEARATDAAFGRFLEELGQGITIDEHGLDECIMQQADLFYRVSERLALTISRRDEAKDNLKITEAEVRAIIRADAEQEERKISEATVAEQCILHGDVRAAARELAKLNDHVGQLSALRDGYTQRSYMLKEMVSLFLTRYYGDTPNAPRKQVETLAKAKQYDDNKRTINRARRQREEE